MILLQITHVISLTLIVGLLIRQFIQRCMALAILKKIEMKKNLFLQPRKVTQYRNIFFVQLNWRHTYVIPN